MKGLSFYGEWLWCVFHAGKLIDNRKQAWTYRGRILLCTSREPGGVVHSDLARRICRAVGVEPPERWNMPGGLAFGTAELVDVIPKMNEEVAKVFAAKHGLDLRWWFRDHVGLVLKDPKLFDRPFHVRGALGLWPVSGEIAARVEEHADLARTQG